MSLGPLDVTPIVERIRALVPDFQMVCGAADRATAQESRLRFPCAFVILAGEQVASESLTGVMRHQADAKVDVLIGVRHYQGDQRGTPHAEAGIPLVAKVREALHGWTPAGPTGARVEPMRIQGKGALLQMSDADWWWVDPFLCTYKGRT